MIYACSQENEPISIVNRLGQKKNFAKEIYQHFPPHKVYIEPFFGGGGMFLNKKPLSPINHLNDIDNNIFHLWNVLQHKKDELFEYLENVPYGVPFWEYVKHNEPKNEIEKAVWFVVKSNWGFKGKPDTLKIDNSHIKKMTLKNLENCYAFIARNPSTIIFQSTDFRKFFKSISLKEEKNKTFAYLDKPYSGTANNYGTKGKKLAWTDKDDLDLLETVLGLGINFAISEYNCGSFANLATEAGLQKIYIEGIGDGLNRGQKQEVLFVNYKSNQITLL